MRTPSESNFFHFHAVFAVIFLYNRFLLKTQGLAPMSGKLNTISSGQIVSAILVRNLEARLLCLHCDIKLNGLPTFHVLRCFPLAEKS